jgi:hypothetical protein
VLALRKLADEQLLLLLEAAKASVRKGLHEFLK